MIPKFRAWDDVKNKMYYLGEEENIVFQITSEGIEATDISEGENEFKILHHLKYMQCTELEDVNEKEIYQGDIFEIEVNGENVAFEVMLGEYGYYKDKHYGFYLYCSSTGEELSMFDVKELEVCGNSFENPELLEA